TLPLDWSLWHLMLAHPNLIAGVKLFLDHNLVTGLKLDAKTVPDPAAEPDKMHANPFPMSTSQSSRPLELIHSDVHQVAHSSFSGCHYWVTFIHDYSRCVFVLPIK
ncbi:hypothetical protein L210DRAFT_3324222, partial [Boletus edulis BED1]